MLAIAVLTAGLLRAVMEKWAPARSTTRPSPCGPPAPAAFAAASASATSRGAPRAEFVEPFRSRVAYVDIDDTVKATYGYAKQGAGYGYSGVKGLNALLATVSSPLAAPV